MIFPGADEDAPEPRATALYAAGAAASSANSWTSINGWAAARVYSSVAEEYAALVEDAAVIDVSALCRYTVRGYQASSVLARLTTTPVKELLVGESARGLILDNAGMTVDNAGVTRLSGDLYLLTTALPIDRRLQLAARGFDVIVENITGHVAALALLGPKATAAAALAGVETSREALAAKGRVRGVEIAVLPIQVGAVGGVEIIYPEQDAIVLWDRLRRSRAVRPAGLDALDIVRIEGGAPRIGVDFIGADLAATLRQRRSPDEIGLPHLAPANRAWFSGRSGLKQASSCAERYLVVLAADADAIFAGAAVYDRKQAVGRVASSVFSPRLRRALCFADIAVASVGKPLEIACADAGGGRVGAHLYETPESRSAAAFRASLRAATENRD